MAVIEGGVSAALAGVGAETASGIHVVPKPIPHGALGHYICTHQVVLVNNQAANSRIFELRNTHATNLIVLTRLDIRWLQNAAHTAAILDALDAYKCTAFSAVDTTNTTTPTVSVKRTNMAAVPGGAALRVLTAAGNSAGMTGGTLTKDSLPFAQLPKWLLAAVPTAGPVDPSLLQALATGPDGTYPFVFVQNEGFIVENRTLLGAAAGSSINIICEWAEVTAF